MPGLISPMLRFMRLALWLAATVFGVGAVVCDLASFAEPHYAGTAIAWFVVAVALLYARDRTPAAL